ncbi:hypothetical protein NECAME_10189 [Necator americanus]|uniref:Beige/BEACH domain protein n=1 Tax=Necator americanus TaxID=51031 RepID=W2TAW2_NECAM|nr:hypothetical protein NECAME_10189 [Necator americanus]ETN78724.1 hypothetical protein NECAME_10189 [Necator americanus]
MGEKADRTLTLLHLRKTFSEYMRIPLSGSRDVDPNRLLPLFTKVMAMFTPAELKAEFKEILNFTTFLSSVLVREVRQRASSHGTLEAAVSIAEYLQPSSAQKGWLLLNSVYFLVSTDDEAIINAVCKVSLPSTLVKTIYLFFDLPDNGEFVDPWQKLNELITCLLDRLCSYKYVSEELAKKDDLLLLFIGSSSSLSAHNVQWRKTTARMLEALSAKSLTPIVIKYIHTKECIRTFISNVKSPKLQPQEAAEMIICLLCVLKDSARQTNQLIEDFSQSNGYLAIKDFILKNENNQEIVRNILLMLISVITNGPQEIKPQHSSGLVQLPTFNLPNPSGNGLSVRNTQAFGLVHKVFFESHSPAICAMAIDIVHSIYTCDPANYFILDKEYPLALFIEQLDRKDEVVRAKILELVEHCVFHLNYIPCKELIGICVQMKTELASGQQDICISAVQAAFRLLTVDSLIKDAFREVGLLDTLCYIINNLFAQYKQRSLTENETKLTLLATDLLTVIIKGNLENARMFSDCFGARTLLSVLTVVTGEWRSSSLQLLKQLLLLASTDQYIAGVIQVISQVAPQQQLEFNVDLLKTVLGVLRESHKVRVQFRKTGGYLGLLTMLLGLEGAFSMISGTGGTVPAEAVELLDFIHLVFKVLTISMRFEPSNAKYFSVEVSWDSITTVLRLTGAFGENTVIDVIQPEWKLQGSDLKDELAACHSVFKMDEDIQAGSIPTGMPPSIFFASYIIRLLFNMALDNYEKCVKCFVHPGAVQSILSLLPSISSDSVKWMVSAQYYCGLLLKALLKPERNQQLMCQVRRILHFLRLDLPLCCRNLDETENEEPIRSNEGGPVPLQRVKALVSMMTPRDQRLSHAPSFVETDLAMEGWLYIDAFSDKKLDAHPLRLLTITRTVTWQDERRKQGPCQLACLTIQVSPMDRSLLISTDEHENPGGDLEKEAKIPSEKAIRVALADIVRPMEWTHVCVVLSRSVLKPSQASVYINGRLVSSQRLQYIVQTAGGAATQLAQTHVVNAVIGTLPAMRRPSRLSQHYTPHLIIRFRLASTFLIEEPLSAETVRSIYDLQPHYVGSLQAIGPERTSLVQEEKVGNLLFCLGISSSDNSTPLRIMLNTVFHAPGSGRAFGAVIIGYLGMRTFIPRPVPRLLDSMGGFACLYGLVAMATDSEGLYASLKAVVSAVRSNSNLQATLHANRAYQTLAVLLEDKANLLNSHIMHMVFSMAGTLDTAREVATIPNGQAFEDLLCDLDVWSSAPDEQHRMLYEHFYELITETDDLAVESQLPFHISELHNQLIANQKPDEANGGWLADADSVVRNRAAVVLGFSVSAHGGAVGSKIDINPELQNCAGFAALEHLMAAHADKPHAYLAMLAVLVGQPVKDLRFCENFSVDQIWTHVFGLSLNSSVYEAIRSAEFCYDALIPLLAMALQGWHVDYPSAVVQMITFLYQNSPNFFAIAHSEEFVLAMFSSLIQDTNAMGVRSETADRSAVGTPELEKVQAVLTLPSVKAVLDFMKKLFCDDFQVAAGGRADSLVDVITESVAENGSTRKVQILTLSALVHAVFDHLISTDLLVSSSLPPNAPPQSLAQVGVNISYMALRAVDCLWNGLLTGEPLKLLQLLYSVYSIASRKENKEIILDSLTSSIMRCVLYILSRPIENVQVQMSVLDTLSSVVTKRYIFLSSNESWFFTSLTHLIFMLSVTPDIMQHDGEPLEKASAQVAVCASRVWTDVISSKKALLEEAFKKPTVCELNAARALLANVAGQHWHQFVDSQLSGHCQNHTISKDIQTQISSKITRVASGLHKLASKRTLSSHGSISAALPWKNVSVDKEVIHMWLRVHVSLVKELVAAQATRYHEWHAHAKKWSLHEWHQLEAELTRERGIWGPEKASVLDKYKLDTTEGPSRTRRKMIPNRFFYHTFPYRPHLDEPGAKSMRAKVAISRDSELYFNACRRRRGRIIDTRIIDYSVAISTPSEEKPAFTFCDLAQINTSLIRRLSTRPLLEAPNAMSCENDGNSKENDNGDENGAKDPSVELEDDQQDESSASDKPMSESREEVKEEEKKDNEMKKKRGPDNQTLLRLLEQGEQLHSMFRCARIQGLETSEGLLLFGREHYYVVDGFTLLKTREIRDLDFLSQELHDPIVPYTATGATHPPRSSRLCSKFSYEDIREVHKRRYLLQPIALEVFSADGRNYLLAFPKKMRDRVYEKLLSMAKGLTSGGTDSVGGQKANMAIEQSGRASLINSIIGQQSVTQRWLNGQITNFQYLIHLNTLAGRSYNDLSQYPILPWVLADYTSTSLDFTNPKTFRDLSKPMGAQHPQRLEQFLKRYREWDDPTGETPPYMYGTHYSSAMIVVSYLVRLEPFTQQFLSLQGGHFDLADRMFHSIGDAWTSASRNNMADVKELIPEFFVLPELLLNKNRFDFGVKQNGVALDNVILPPWAHGDAREFIRLHRQALECDYVSSHLHEWIDLVFGYKQNGEEAVKANNLFHHLFYEGSVDFESIIDPLTRNATIGFVNNFGQIPTQLFKKPHPQKKVSPVDGFSNTPGVTTQRLFYHTLHSLKPPQTPIKELRSAVGSIYQSDRTGLVVLEQNKVLIGTNKYIAWGYPDRSIRMGQIDSDRSSCIHEMCDADELTCVASGDDRTLFCGSSTGCVSVWTLCRKPVSLKRRKLLDGHSDAVTCLGDIATSCLTLLHLWSINGELLAVVNTCDSNLVMDPSQMILSLTFSTVNEWDSDNVVVCGTSDGVVKIYSCVMVENDGSVEEPHMEPQVKQGTSSSASVHARLDRVRRRLKVNGSQDTSEAHSPEPPTSPVASGTQMKNTDRLICPQYVRVLLQRAALTVHTAFNRPDNTHPAPITCLAPSRDHKSFLVGDGVGRVWCWQAGEDGGRADHWVQASTILLSDFKDMSRQRCTQCAHKFSIADRKHHCRNCGQIFCAK